MRRSSTRALGVMPGRQSAQLKLARSRLLARVLRLQIRVACASVLAAIFGVLLPRSSRRWRSQPVWPSTCSSAHVLLARARKGKREEQPFFMVRRMTSPAPPSPVASRAPSSDGNLPRDSPHVKNLTSTPQTTFEQCMKGCAYRTSSIHRKFEGYMICQTHSPYSLTVSTISDSIPFRMFIACLLFATRALGRKPFH